MKSIKWEQGALPGIFIAACCGGLKWALLVAAASARIEWKSSHEGGREPNGK
jgi:hypothetical protein